MHGHTLNKAQTISQQDYIGIITLSSTLLLIAILFNYSNRFFAKTLK